MAGIKDNDTCEGIKEGIGNDYNPGQSLEW